MNGNVKTNVIDSHFVADDKRNNVDVVVKKTNLKNSKNIGYIKIFY